MKQAALKINLPKEKWGYFSRVPGWMGERGKRLSPAARALAGRVFGVSKSDKTPDAALWTSYDQIQEELGVCRATVASSVSSLKELELIEENARVREGTSYKFVAKTARRYDIVPLFLYTADVTIGGIERRLTKSQVLILGHFMTEVKRPKNNGKYECSIARLARELNYSETTIKTAIKVLLKARLIYRAAEDKGVNGSKLTTYHVNRELYSYERFRKAKVKKEPKAREISALDTAAEIESYYQKRKQIMIERANDYTQKAYETAPVLKKIDFDLQQMELEIARADLAGDTQKLSILALKGQRLQSERLATLQRFGIDPNRMKKDFYARCKKCLDSGKLPGGKGCSCYKEHEEGV